MVIHKEIDTRKRYAFPEKLHIVNHKGKFLIISVETGNWIVLDNDNQLCFFHLLEKYNIEDSLKLFEKEYNDAVNVIIQLEARKFENTKVIPSYKSSSVFIYLTNACNMRCPHCYMTSGHCMYNECSTQEILNFLVEAKKFGITSVTYSGGEVCIRPDFTEIINRTYEMGFQIEVFTNGTLWTDNMINELASKITEIQISIDGYCEEENARVRGKGNFEKALKTVDQFVNLGVDTRIATTPFFDKSIKDKANNYIDFANKLLEKYKKKNFRFLFTGDLFDGRNLSLSESEKKEYKKVIEYIYSKVYPNSDDEEFIELHKSFGIYDNCSFGSLTISSDGNVYPCSRIPSIKPIANIRTDSFEKIEKISNIARFCSNVNNLKPCKNCDLKYICGGGCRIINFKEFTTVTDYENFDVTQLKSRDCSKSEKEFAYDLMIKTNREIFQ